MKTILNKKSKTKSSTTPSIKKIPIRVFYKKVDHFPKVKIINDVNLLRKKIVEKNLDIIPYEKLYIICNNKKSMEEMRTNIFLPLKRIGGDFLVINIDEKTRQFKSLSQEDIILYSKDLINKQPIKTSNQKDNINFSKINMYSDIYERGFEENRNAKPNTFENTLINVLVNLELVLASILKDNKNGENKNE